MRKIKNIFITIGFLSLLIIHSSAFAISDEDFYLLKQKAYDEKQFVLEALTGSEGNDAGKRPTRGFRNGSRFFFVTDCNGKCKEERLIVLKALQSFANDYNEVYGSERVVINTNKSSGYYSTNEVRIKLINDEVYLSQHRNNTGYLYCHFDEDSRPIIKGCWIKLAIKDRDMNRIAWTAVHESLNSLGLFDTKRSIFRYCVLFDGALALIKNRYGYQGLCPMEKKLIVFQRDKIRAGLRKSSVSELFDRHWVS